jgi:hypothetical protein
MSGDAVRGSACATNSFHQSSDFGLGGQDIDEIENQPSPGNMESPWLPAYP